MDPDDRKLFIDAYRSLRKSEGLADITSYPQRGTDLFLLSLAADPNRYH